jgi:Family of unknown function (DUF6230)
MASTETAAPNAEPLSGKVRFRRFAAVMVPAAVVGGVMVALTAQGVLAAQFSISGINFTVTADQLKGNGFEQFGLIDNTKDGSPNLQDTGGQATVVVSVIGDAHLWNLCQSINLGGINLVLRAGRNGTPVHATDLVTDSDTLSGDASFDTIQIGRDASDLDAVPGIVGPIGDFGQQAKDVTINKLRQDNYATTAATFTLPGLSLGFQSDGC